MQTFTISDLSFTYPGQQAPALQQLSFGVEAGSFTVLCGRSGCGKSTLLRQLKPSLQPHGAQSGSILFEGTPLNTLSQREQSARIGFVLQNLDAQLVTDKVWHELAFGLESLGLDTQTIRRRVAETASYFGIQNWFYRPVAELSGGQKQLVNLASVMALEPSVLLLDEPTSQLDPIAATDFLATLGRINRELGTTILLSEHRLDEALALATDVIVLDQGRIYARGTAMEVGEQLKQARSGMFAAMPVPMRIYAAVENELACPVTVGQGRVWLEAFAKEHPLRPISPAAAPAHPEKAPAVQIEEAFFRYEKNAPDVIKALSLKAYPGELLAILGGNGTGKSTTLRLISGLSRPYRGSVQVLGKAPDEVPDRIALLAQDPQTLFVKNTVREDLEEMLSDQKLSKQEKNEQIGGVALLCDIIPLLDRHPYDLSGGEQQRAALAKVLLLRPKILLLDEPTKGLDAEFKQTFASIIRGLLNSGVCIVMVSHDVEFCAEYADRCAFFFDGGVVSEDTPVRFFSGKNFYTTASNRMARHLLPSAVTVNDVIAACGGQPNPEPPAKDAGSFFLPEPTGKSAPKQEKKLPWWRRIIALISGLSALGIFIHIISSVNLTELVTAERLSDVSNSYTSIYAWLLTALAVFAVSITQKGAGTTVPTRQKGKLSKRTIAAAVMIVLLIPLTFILGYHFFGDRKYLLMSLLIILETMVPFVLVFESRKPQARELVVIAVLCAIGIVGRAAFIAVPSFKPVAAIVIVAGVAFGGETGFLVGAMTMFGSNMLFGQGPWTPWQMFAMGLIGFLAGVLFRKGVLRRSRFALCVYAALTIIIIYGGLMNPASVLMSQNDPTLPMFFTAYLTGFPVDMMHAAATVFFLWVLSQPLLEKLDRIKVKYGLIEA